MTEVDPQITAILDRLQPKPHETGDWHGVLTDAGEILRTRRVSGRRLALAFIALAGLAAALAFVPALAGQGYFWFLDYGAPKPTTAVVTVTSITDQSGTTWQLTAYQSEKQGLCFQLTPEDGAGGAGACGSPLPVGEMIIGQSAGTTFVLGPVTPEARRVVITGSGGEVEAKLAAAPEALHSDVQFYVAQLPAGMANASMTVRALDEQGRVVGSRSSPARSRP